MRNNTLGKLLALLLALTLVFSLAGCDEPAPEEPKDYKYKNVIYIIGDGMGEAHLDAGELIYGREYAFRDSFSKVMVNTNSLDKKGEATEVTDSAASATALATGVLTYNKYVGMDTNMKELKTVMDTASETGRATGIVTTDTLCGATPAGFSAHSNNRNLEHDIIRSQASSGVDLLIGQYYDKYEEHATDITKNYSFFTEYDRDAILAAEGDALCAVPIESDENAPSLAEVTSLAIERLSKDPDGFVLMIEQAHIDKYSHDKDLSGAAKSADSLNDTVEAALRFAEGRDDTVIIVTADHETCGLRVSTDPSELSSKHEKVGGGEISYEYSANYHTDTEVPLYTWGFEYDYSALATFSSAELIKNFEIANIVDSLIKIENE